MAGVIPYTIFLVAPTNRVLMARLAKLEKESESESRDANGKPQDAVGADKLHEARQLDGRWAMLYCGRFLLPFVRSVLAWTVW